MSLRTELPEKLKRRLKSGTITKQKLWKFIKELNTFSEERLDSIALISDGVRISYREMFDAWDRYAGVFSALGITETDHSRAGFFSDRDSESVFSFYGLNMTGASVSMLHELDIMDRKRWDQMIIKEGITDLVLTDRKLTRSRLQYIWESRDRLGIRNVIVLHDPLNENSSFNRLKKIEGVLFMDELLDKYPDHDIDFGTEKPAEDAVIFHTSGTTMGIHKPVPISDRGFNESAARLLRDKRFDELENVVSILCLELCSAYGACDMLHLPLGYGGSVVLMPEGAGERKMLRAVRDYRVTILFAVKDLFELMEEVSPRPDLSSLELVFLGGSYVSPDAKRRYCDFLKECGSKGSILVGYGMTETAGAVTLADADCFTDSIGRPLSGVSVKIFDEDEEKYYELSDGERIGVLCVSSPSVSSGKLNGQSFFELTDIDGESYLNTYDLVEVSEDESLRIIGRMNKFFVNNEGIRFDAGLIETVVSSEPDVAACGLVPEYNKQLHDTIPVLYIQFAQASGEDRGTGSKRALVEDMLFRIFVKENRIKDTNLPSMAVICKELPLNGTGKVDVHSIARGYVKGKRYTIKPVRKNGRLVNVRVVSWKHAGMFVNGGVPEELEYDLELVEELFEGSETDMSKESKKAFGPFYFARLIRGFMEELEEEEKKRRKKRRKRMRNRFEDMNDFYSGFGDRYDDEDEDEDDDVDEAEDVEDEEDDDDDDDDEDDDDDDDDDDGKSSRGCAREPGKKDVRRLLRRAGRYFSASDYDKDYEE